jgi:hypothetical protein
VRRQAFVRSELLINPIRPIAKLAKEATSAVRSVVEQPM